MFCAESGADRAQNMTPPSGTIDFDGPLPHCASICTARMTETSIRQTSCITTDLNRNPPQCKGGWAGQRVEDSREVSGIRGAVVGGRDQKLIPSSEGLGLWQNTTVDVLLHSLDRYSTSLPNHCLFSIPANQHADSLFTSSNGYDITPVYPVSHR